MLEPDRVAAMTAGLTECAQDPCDVSDAPEFQLIFEWAPRDEPPTLEFLTIHETVWRHWDTHRRLPARVTLADFTHLLTSTVSQWLPDLAHPHPDATLVGCSLMYDRPADDNTGAGSRTATRIIVARDIDGRTYQAIGSAGKHDATMHVSHGRVPTGRAATAAAALNHILASRVTAVHRLPTTGYVALHTVERDGEQPYEITPPSSTPPGPWTTPQPPST